MKHDINIFAALLQTIDNIDNQMGENLLSRMDNDFDKTLEEPDHKRRSKLVKQHKRNVEEVTPVVSQIYPMQIRMTHIKTNLSFLLECACYNLSYKSIARYFAEYDFLSQQISKEAGKVKNDVMKDFLSRSTVLSTNWFQMMTETINIMEHLIIHKMHREPEIYIDLNIEEDSKIDFDEIKMEYKNTLKKLKEDLKKQKKVA